MVEKIFLLLFFSVFSIVVYTETQQEMNYNAAIAYQKAHMDPEQHIYQQIIKKEHRRYFLSKKLDNSPKI